MFAKFCIALGATMRWWKQAVRDSSSGLLRAFNLGFAEPGTASHAAELLNFMARAKN
jgi:hypothetical protein